ncbi:MAG: iron donor protein CyaY [Betaproteobacteria bacterium]|nr:iron donor protein CyaY [Betaproteobacteria bacterium]
MTEPDFLAECDRVLTAIEDALDACGADVQSGRTGPVLEIEFEDDSRLIVNGNAPVREMWVAARAGGFHFRHDGSVWRDTRSGEELFASLSRLVSAQSGQAVRLSDPG